MKYSFSTYAHNKSCVHLQLLNNAQWARETLRANGRKLAFQRNRRHNKAVNNATYLENASREKIMRDVNRSGAATANLWLHAHQNAPNLLEAI